MENKKKYEDGAPCEHPGCLNHVTHPCEGCGRINGKPKIKVMNLNRFVNEFVKIEYIDNAKCFGHFPFNMYSKKEGEKVEFASIYYNDIKEVYTLAAIKINDGAEIVIQSTDYPQLGNLKGDFVCAICYDKGKYSAMAVVYNKDNGKIIEYNDQHNPEVETILKQFIQFMKNIKFKKKE